MPKTKQDIVKDFWETDLARALNRRDVVLKELEIRAIGRHVQHGDRVLDLGCGDGETAVALATQAGAYVVGYDRSVSMVEAANARDKPARGEVRFCQADATGDNLPDEIDTFDLVYTERLLVNLADWSAQERLIRDVLRRLKPGAKFIACEHRQEGLDQVNEWRAGAELPAITPPSYNRYLHDAEIEVLTEAEGARLIETDNFSGLYYWLSRVVNARLAADLETEPDYGSPVNGLALRVPNLPGLGGSQGVCWVWRKVTAAP